MHLHRLHLGNLASALKREKYLAASKIQAFFRGNSSRICLYKVMCCRVFNFSLLKLHDHLRRHHDFTDDFFFDESSCAIILSFQVFCHLRSRNTTTDDDITADEEAIEEAVEEADEAIDFDTNDIAEDVPFELSSRDVNVTDGVTYDVAYGVPFDISDVSDDVTSRKFDVADDVSDNVAYDVPFKVPGAFLLEIFLPRRRG